MGAAHSAHHSVLASHEQLLAQLAGPAAIDYGDAFWAVLLDCPTPLASLDPVALEAAVVPHVRQLREFLVLFRKLG